LYFISPALTKVQLLHAQQRRIKQAFRPGTQRNHDTQLKMYFQFCSTYNVSTLQPSQQDICLYLEFLARRFKSPQSVKNYLSAVTLYHKQKDISCEALSTFKVQCMIRSLDRTMHHVPNQKEPISLTMLHQLSQLTLHYGVWGEVLRCAFLFMFFAFLRQSNIAPRSRADYDPTRHTRRSDVTFTPSGLILDIKWTKTIQKRGHPVRIPLPRIPGSILCPTRAFRTMQLHVPATRTNTPLLVMKNTEGHVVMVTTHNLQQGLCKLVTALGLPPSTYTLHSFRRGGATLAFGAGIPLDLIKGHGTWDSNAVWEYIRTPSDTQSTVPATLAATVLKHHF
jgi:integrase